ncbi:uncharacterized protein J4E78_006864 [Alternaria triticimaculans]|uniref:uncharacterized protein n=1 Tax=Alternaria triticimaculans TaxID=297637 RepID=UPI0020C58FEE|nr:uncharacterized protein J4E78_006864 [Alternaria triticimaculans]KAI4656973.1 hypothetical protein J4E78_006864 [Alternaria triticimaculans]
MPLSDFQIPDTVKGLKAALSNVDEEEHEQARLASDDLRLLGAKRLAIRTYRLLLSKRDQQCREAIQELPNAVLEKLPRELRDMIYTELYRGELYHGSQDEPYEIVDNNSKHPHDSLYEFVPMIKAYEPPYWMLEEEVGPEFAREAVEVWYKSAYLSVDIKLLQPLLQDDDGVLYDSWSPSICRSLSTLLEEQSVARKEGFKLHIAFHWDVSDNWPEYLKAICPVVYRLKTQGFLVSSTQAYGNRTYGPCARPGCECDQWTAGGPIRWYISDIGDWFDCSEEECMKRIEEQKERRRG